jgi:O-antigen ligase
MIKSGYSLLSHPRAWLVLQASGLVILTLILIDVLSGGTRDLFLTAILGGIGAFWIMHKPYLGVLLILASWFIEIDVIRIPFLSIPYLVSAILMIPLGLSILRDRGCWLLGVRQIQVFLIIGLLYVVSTWWSEFMYPITLFPEMDETTRKMQIFVTRLAFLFYFLYFMRTRRTIETAVWLIVILITFAALSAVLQGGDFEKRATAEFSLATNSNRLAYICLFATTLLWFYRSYSPKSRWNLLTLPALVLLPLIALRAGSRSGLLQIIVLAALIIKEQEGWSASKRLRTLVFLGCLGVLIQVVVPAAQLIRATTFDPAVDARGQKSLQKRTSRVLWSARMIADHPILGVGIGNMKWVGRAYYDEGGDPHNSYLEAFGSGGVGVLALYLLLFYVTHRNLLQLERTGPRELLWLSKAIKVNLVLFLIFSAFADFWFSDFLYLIIGLTVAIVYIDERRNDRPVAILLSKSSIGYGLPNALR